MWNNRKLIFIDVDDVNEDQDIINNDEVVFEVEICALKTVSILLSQKLFCTRLPITLVGVSRSISHAFLSNAGPFLKKSIYRLINIDNHWSILSKWHS